MLHWKNKPIDQLSKAELQKALSDSVGMVLANKAVDQNSDIFATFMMGLAAGAFIAITGVYFSSLI